MAEKNNPHGATPSEWDNLIKDLGFAKQDILPVVSNPDALVSENSTMKHLGKTPSLYNSDRKVVGIAKWTQKKATDKDLQRWREEPDYGICIQTRLVRAIDIDVEDEAKAREIVSELHDFLGFKLPLRYRSNSGKVLLACIVEGDFGKQVIKVNGGMVEMLATGQQFIAAGTHPSGVKYQWKDTQNGFPVLTTEQYDDLVWFLGDGFGIAPTSKRGLRKAGDSDYAEADDVMKYLAEKGLVLEYGNEGQAHIECPFSHEHTTESSVSATSYFPANSRGYAQGHFSCLHAHCQERDDSEFLDALGASLVGFDVPDLSEMAAGEPAPLPKVSRDKSGEVYALLNNVLAAVERPDMCGCEVKYDEFRDEVAFRDFETGKWERENDNRLIRMRIRLEARYKFKSIPKEMMRDVVHTVSRANSFDTAQEWLKDLAWDGVPRVRYFVHKYLGGDNTPYAHAVSYYMWSALAGRVIEPGVKADMIPIMKGPQGYMKSTAISMMAPSRAEFAELDFDESDNDLARKMRGKLLCEIPELRGLRTKAIEAIKAFVARTHEEWVPKYKEYSTYFARRCIFIATTNEDEFLADSTGNRRWLPFEVVRPTDLSAIERDRAQLWAEARVLFLKNGVMWQEAEKLGAAEHEAYMMGSVLGEVVGEWLSTPEGLDGEGDKPEDKDYLRLLDVAREACGLDPARMKRIDEINVANALREQGYVKRNRRIECPETSEIKQAKVWLKDKSYELA